MWILNQLKKDQIHNFEVDLRKKDIYVKIKRWGKDYPNSVFRLDFGSAPRLLILQFPFYNSRYGDNVIIHNNTSHPSAAAGHFVLDKNIHIVLSSKEEYYKFHKIKIMRRGPHLKSSIVKTANFTNIPSYGGSGYNTKRSYYNKNDIKIPFSFYENLSTDVDPKAKLYLSTDNILNKETIATLNIENNIEKADTIVLDYDMIYKIYNPTVLYYYNNSNKTYYNKNNKNNSYDVIYDINFNTAQIKYLKFLETYSNNPKYKLILNKSLINNFGEDKSVIDKDLFLSLNGMLKSSNKGDKVLARDIIVNSRYDESKLYLLLLLNKCHQMKIKNNDFKVICKYFNIPSKEFRKDWKYFVKYIIENNIVTDKKDIEGLMEYTKESIINEMNPYFNITNVDIKI